MLKQDCLCMSNSIQFTIHDWNTETHGTILGFGSQSLQKFVLWSQVLLLWVKFCNYIHSRWHVYKDLWQPEVISSLYMYSQTIYSHNLILTLTDRLLFFTLSNCYPTHPLSHLLPNVCAWWAQSENCGKGKVIMAFRVGIYWQHSHQGKVKGPTSHGLCCPLVIFIPVLDWTFLL